MNQKHQDTLSHALDKEFVCQVGVNLWGPGPGKVGSVPHRVLDPGSPPQHSLMLLLLGHLLIQRMPW